MVHHRGTDPADTAGWVAGSPAPETIVIAPHDPGWVALAAELAERVRGLVPAALSVAHIGSTAVPGLAAKPVIDLDLVVPDPTLEDSYLPSLQAAGWVLRVREPWWHEHRCLRLDPPRSNLHVWGPDSPELVRHRIFRDWLRGHPEDRERYAAAKRRAAAGGEIAIQDYTARKDAVVREIYDRAFRAAGLLGT